MVTEVGSETQEQKIRRLEFLVNQSVQHVSGNDIFLLLAMTHNWGPRQYRDCITVFESAENERLTSGDYRPGELRRQIADATGLTLKQSELLVSDVYHSQQFQEVCMDYARQLLSARGSLPRELGAMASKVEVSA